MFYNGGFQARQQFGATCYSESATRLILKLFKNKGLLREIPKSNELDDFEKNIIGRVKEIRSNFYIQPHDDYKITEKRTELESKIKKHIEDYSQEIKDEINKLITELNDDMTEQNDEIDKLKEKIDILEKQYDEMLVQYDSEEQLNDLMKEIIILKQKHKNLKSDLGDLITEYNYRSIQIQLTQDSIINDLLKKRKEFLKTDAQLKEIIEEQDKYFKLLNTFFILKIGISSGQTNLVFLWFVNYMNNITIFNGTDENGIRILKHDNIYEGKTPADHIDIADTCTISRSGLLTSGNCISMTDNDYSELYFFFKKMAVKLAQDNFNLQLMQIRMKNEVSAINSIIFELVQQRYVCIILKMILNSKFDLNFINSAIDLNTFLNSTQYEKSYCKNPIVNTTRYHALIISGYKEINGELYFIVKNSWGILWGDFGKVEIKASLLFSNLCVDCVYIIQINNKLPTKGGKRKSRRKQNMKKSRKRGKQITLYRK